MMVKFGVLLALKLRQFLRQRQSVHLVILRVRPRLVFNYDKDLTLQLDILVLVILFYRELNKLSIPLRSSI